MDFTCFSSAHENILQIDYILGHKSSLGKLKTFVDAAKRALSDMAESPDTTPLDNHCRKRTNDSTEKAIISSGNLCRYILSKTVSGLPRWRSGKDSGC